MSALFLLLISELADLNVQSPSYDHSLSAEIVHLVNNTPHYNFRVSEISEKLGVSGKTIEAAMKHSVGMSFSKYQMNRKLEMVARQIEVEPDIRLAEIASTFGFCDEFHLSRAFKSKYGVSPALYKKRQR